MGIFDLFRKKDKTPGYDATNLQITDIKEGFIFDYDLESWSVKRKATYDWGDDCFTDELQIFNGKETKYLSIEEDDEISIEISQSIPISTVDEGSIPQYIHTYKKAPYNIKYNGVNYKLMSESSGYYQKNEDASWDEVISWRYESNESDHFVDIDQWDDMEFEASVGKSIKPYEISNILPR
ncbi:DUF4178 domain-containing protein [Halosquirtibacter laminarini]|uniref:DUF4178 domain-containing protein n=1 Tax=Halosquirtibacter laminarini TaxID=3374600 RepID=A0AC61NGY2_9BACT|nr:DUF4178 domain-containing protein [Prolixibacteraceae bacterium]